jgi:hypothetical protein
MKKILFLIVLTLLGWSASAKEKLYILNPSSTGGSFNAQMVAYAEDLSAYYDVEYVQGKGCQKASSNVQRIIKNNNQVFHIWNGLRTADFLNGKNPLCGMIPTEQNFVNSVLKYPLFFTGTDGIDKKDIFKDDIKVGYNSTTNKEYLQKLAEFHGINWHLVRYENSKGVVLGVMNNEVEFAMINSASSFWKKSDRLKALYTLNAVEENGIQPLRSISQFPGASNGTVDVFLLQGNGDNLKLRNVVNDILNNPKSKTYLWYSNTKGYTQTIDMDVKQAISISRKYINFWVVGDKLK